MEGVNQKVDRISGDVQNLLSLYDFAEKLYPYSNLREGDSLNENERRRQQVQFASYHDGRQYLNGTGFWGLTTMLLMARANSGSWMDSRALTANPMKTLCWFMIGVSLSAVVNYSHFRQSGYDPKSYHLNLRVS